MTNGHAMRNVPVGVALLRSAIPGVAWGEIMANALAAAVPKLVIFPLSQRQLACRRADRGRAEVKKGPAVPQQAAVARARPRNTAMPSSPMPNSSTDDGSGIVFWLPPLVMLLL